MPLSNQVSQQRVKYILSSYQLSGDELSPMELYLEELFQSYPTALIELALVETLVDHWLTLPPVKGVAFLTQVHKTLRNWESHPIISTITPNQFKQITGLDPTPVFGSAELPPPRRIVHPS